MAANPDFLHPRATETHKTYIGSSFCAGELNLRQIYEGLPAQICIGINEARANVQSGAGIVSELD